MDVTLDPTRTRLLDAAATLFAIYFLDRFGEEATQTLVQNPENGSTGFAQTLAELNLSLSFDDLFADWTAANYLAGIERGEGVYQYHSLDMPAIKPETIRRFPPPMVWISAQSCHSVLMILTKPSSISKSRAIRPLNCSSLRLPPVSKMPRYWHRPTAPKSVLI